VVTRDSLGDLPGYPFASQFLDVGGWPMHFVDEGPRHAHALVMVHGNPSWSYFFRSLVTGLSPNYRCIVPDHIGMGLSARPDDDAYKYELSQRVDDLETLIDASDVSGPITLVLHDWGGMIGMTYAARHPERIARLVLLNTGAFRLPVAAHVPWQIRAFRGPLGQLLIGKFNAFCRGAARFCATTGLSPAERQAYLGPYASWPERRAVLRFVEDIPLGPEDSAFATLEKVEAGYTQFAHVPTLLLWGLRDFVFTERFLDRFIELLPHASVKRFPRGGHYLLEDHPHETLAAVGAFLDSTVAANGQEVPR
jgi:pimeloyl-ACP methyl ester carboxylesterase